jgi:hypothetical protein
MLSVSREDVITDRIVDYGSRSYMRVPIDGYLELMGIEPIPPQIAVINAINNPKYRFICAALSRRTGKTFIANVIAQCVALIPNASVLIMSPNYSLSQISFELQRSLINQFDLEVAKNNVKDRVITLSNGSSIRMGSISQVDSCVGRSYDLILFDEAALTNAGEDAFNIALRPTLDKENSKAIFISTPRGKNNWFSKFFQRGFSSDYPAWASIHSDYRENPRVSEEDIAEARATMSKQEFEQEYLASFTTFEGQIWQLPQDNIVTEFPDVDFSKMDKIAGLDIGFKDSTALAVFAYDDINDIYYLVDEYKDAEKTTAAHAACIKERLNKWDVDFVYIDSAAAQTKFDLAQLYDISCTNAKKSILDGIAHVGSIIDTGRLLVNADCLHSLESIDQYVWDARPGLTKEKPVHNDASHMADAIRYALYSYATSGVGVF